MSEQEPKADIQPVSIPLSLDTKQGKIRVYVSFPGDAASNQETMFDLVEDLTEKGLLDNVAGIGSVTVEVLK